MEDAKNEIRPFDNPELVVLRNPVAKAKFGLSLVQSKILFEVIAYFKSRPNDTFFSLNVRDLLVKIGVETKRLRYYVEEIEEMTKKHLRIPEGENDGGINYLAVNLLAGARFRIDKNGSGYIDMEVSGMLKPYYLEIAKGDFFSYHILNTRALKSTYAIKLYLLLKSYKNLGRLNMSLDELKTILEISHDTYKLFPDFKKRVLERARSEINEKNDIWFSYEEVRESARNSKSPVERIIFQIKDNPNKKENLSRLAAGEKQRLRKTRSAEPPIFADFEEIESPALADSSDLPEPEILKVEEPPADFAQKIAVEPPPNPKTAAEREAIELFRRFDKEGGEEEILDYVGSLGYDVERVLDGLHYAFQQGTVKNIYAYLPTILKAKAGQGMAEKARQRRAAAQKSETEKRRLAELNQQYNDLLEDVEAVKRAIVREIVASDDTATERVVEQVKLKYGGSFGIGGHSTVEDFRENPLLRGMVLQEFRVQFPAVFGQSERLRNLENQILEVKKLRKAIDPHA